MDALVCPLCRIALTAVEDVAEPVCPRDGRHGVHADWIPVPAGLSQRFRVLEQFAHGATGSLYLADEPETGRRGLLKVLAPIGKEQLSERQRLRRELVKQATLARSHLVVPLASGEVDGLTWVFREWLDGVSLEVRLSREGALQQTEALAIAAQVASALDELHRGGLLHRDVKPGHIFLQPSPQGIPRALLLDAGLAAMLEGPAGSPPVYGTAGYVAPEQLLGKLTSFRSDLYSLGCTLYRMLTGRPAFPGETVASTLSAQRYGELPPLPSDLPPGIGALLRSILSKDPQQRPFSAQKLRRTLDPFLPDGALMEKQQTTSTYEGLPQGTAASEGSQAPQPSGTLRPPPPPARASLPPPRPSVRLNSAPPAPPQGARANSAPPAPPQSARPREEHTQQIDIGQIMEVSAARRSTASVPPPSARSNSSVPPTRPTSSLPPPTPPDARSISEKTQPIRLDQILAVEGARKAAAANPPARKEEPAPLMTPPAAQAKSPARATVHGMAPPAAQGALFNQTNAGIGVTTQQPAPAQPTPPAAQPAPAPDEQAAPGRPLFAQLDEPLQQAADPSGPMFEQPAPQPQKPAMKSTLLGLGGSNSVDVTFEAPRAQPAQALSTQPMSAPRARSERDHPTERLPVGESDFDDDQTVDASRTLSFPAGTLSSLRASIFESRRGMMYAGAAVVGLGVVVVAASALFSDPAPVANNAQAPVVAPVAVAPQPSLPAVAAAPTPAPVVEPIAATPVAQPVASAPAGTPRVEPLADPTPRAREPEAEPSAREARSRVVASAPAPSKSKRAEPAPKERTKSAKTSAATKTNDKAAQFSAAREDARDAYAAKNYKAAAAAYERATKFDPKHAGSFAGLGASRLQLGENKAAIAAYQRAVQLSPDTSGFHAALGRAYLANGERSKAVSSYKKALQLDPRNEAAKAALAQIGG